MQLVLKDRNDHRLLRTLATLFAFVLPIALLLFFGEPTGKIDVGRLAAWLCAIAGIVSLVILLGFEFRGRVWGVLIDERNRYSLARLQMVMWTILVLASLYVIFVANALRGDADSVMNVKIDYNLILLMGFSVTSFVVAPVALSRKADRPAAPESLARNGEELRSMQKLSDAPTSQGQLLTKESAADARLGDLVRGEEVGNATTVDLPRAQMLLITVVVVVGVAISIGICIASKTAVLVKLPDIQETIMLLVLLSHGGYLAGKIAPANSASSAASVSDTARLIAVGQRASELVVKLRSASATLIAGDPKGSLLAALLDLAQGVASDASKLSTRTSSGALNTEQVALLEGRVMALEEAQSVFSGAQVLGDVPLSDIVVKVQSKLKALGYAVRTDGVADIGTEKAISDWLVTAGATRAGLHPRRDRYYEELAQLI